MTLGEPMSSNQARELPEPDSVTAELIAINSQCHVMELLFFFAFAFERRSCYRQNRLLSAANEAKPSPYSGSALTPKTSVKWLFGPPSYSASVEPPARFEP
ncbi:cytochrome c oxidase subunit 1, partial [Striga asiatica]